MKLPGHQRGIEKIAARSHAGQSGLFQIVPVLLLEQRHVALHDLIDERRDLFIVILVAITHPIGHRGLHLVAQDVCIDGPVMNGLYVIGCQRIDTMGVVFQSCIFVFAHLLVVNDYQRAGFSHLGFGIIDQVLLRLRDAQQAAEFFDFLAWYLPATPFA